MNGARAQRDHGRSRGLVWTLGPSSSRARRDGVTTALRGTLACLVVPLTACSTFNFLPSTSTPVAADQFNRASAPTGLGPQVRVPGAIFAQPIVEKQEMVTVEPIGEAFVEKRSEEVTTMPSGANATIPLGPETVAAELPPGKPWPVDALVGQINGKPIYADDFLKGMSDRLIQLGKATDRAAARREMIRLVSMRFEEEVNNRLIISEAESSIPPEAREGLFAFLRQLQEQEIADRGGTLSGATASLQDQFGMSVEEFIERRKNEALANDLIRKRIEPRAIVTWRDIERAYEKARDAYAPGATITIGRILVMNSEPAKIEEVKAQFAAGRSFTEVAHGLGVAQDGVWITEKLGEKGVDGIEGVRAELRAKLRGLEVGQVSEAVTLGAGTWWVSVIAIDRPPARSLFEPGVQLRIKGELQSQRRIQEQIKYFEALRSRWISDDIDQMRMRLLEIAAQRYME